MDVPAKRTGRRIGGLRYGQHLHELACLLFVHLAKSYTLGRGWFHHP
jgi:hypothetical protein